MLRSLWIAKTGMDGQQFNLDVISNNLANAQTTGFKKVIPMFQDLMYTTMRAAGASSNAQNLLPTGLQIGAGAAVTGTERNNNQGTITNTGNKLDVAIKGNGFFQIQLADGTTAYTRDGQFSLSSSGQFVSQAGNTIAPGITIPVEATGITISTAGLVQYSTQTTTTLTPVGSLTLANFANPAGLVALGGGIFVPSPSSGTAQTQTAGTNGMGTTVQYFKEESNVNVAEELVNLIAAQRAYEINTRAVTASDQILQRLSNLGA
jgi:flagellar basal-body rod protein FlgG